MTIHATFNFMLYTVENPVFGSELMDNSPVATTVIAMVEVCLHNRVDPNQRPKITENL